MMSGVLQLLHSFPRGETVSSIICRKISRGRCKIPILSTDYSARWIEDGTYNK